MSATVSTDFLLRVAQATPEQQAAIDRFLDGQVDALKSESGRARLGFPSPPQDGCPKCEDRFAVRGLFRRAGSYWRVVFDGFAEFLLQDTLGASYLDYLLHHPNRAISAFDLEIAVQPEKAEARSKNSFQDASDPQAARVYLRELTRLRQEREEAVEDGQLAEADRLDEEMEALGTAIRCGAQAGDTGERARSNVNKALAAVRRRLAKGDEAEREFGEHIKRAVSVGYQCMYAQPPGRGWE